MTKFEQRSAAALTALKKFASGHGWNLDELAYRIEDNETARVWVYTAPDGREFGCGATWQ